MNKFPSPTGAISSQIECLFCCGGISTVSVPYRGNLISNWPPHWRRHDRYSFRPLPGQSHLNSPRAIPCTLGARWFPSPTGAISSQMRVFVITVIQYCFRPLPGQSHLKYFKKTNKGYNSVSVPYRGNLISNFISLLMTHLRLQSVSVPYRGNLISN